MSQIQATSIMDNRLLLKDDTKQVVRVLLHRCESVIRDRIAAAYPEDVIDTYLNYCCNLNVA